MPLRLPPVLDEQESFQDDTLLPFDLSSDDEEDDGGALMSVEAKARMFDRHSRAADRLSIRLLEVDREDEEDRVLRQTLRLSENEFPSSPKLQAALNMRRQALQKVCTMFSMAVLALAVLGALVFLGIQYVGPPNQPVGPYQLIERQVQYNHHLIYRCV